MIVFTYCLNWKYKKRERIFESLRSDGYKLKAQHRGLFQTTYSFSKII